jgi:hypothetical protein
VVAKFSLQHIPFLSLLHFLPIHRLIFLSSRKPSLSPCGRDAHFLAIFLLFSAFISSHFFGLAIFAPETPPLSFNTIRNSMCYHIQPLPGATAGMPKKPSSAPATVVAGYLASKLGRPSRSRRSLLLSLVLLIAILFQAPGRRHVMSSPKTILWAVFD